MSASQAVLGYGSKFWTGTIASPLGYTAVMEINQITFNDYTVPEIDVTHLLSPNSTEETIPGLLKPGSIECMGNFIGESTQQNLDTMAVARTVFYWKITTPAGTQTLTATGQGFITKMEKGPFGANKKSDFKFSVKVSGAISYSYA